MIRRSLTAALLLTVACTGPASAPSSVEGASPVDGGTLPDGTAAPGATAAPGVELPEVDAGRTPGSTPPDEGGAPPVVTVGEGASCVLSVDCAAGLFCDLGRCAARCRADADCPAGERCSERGRCVEGDEPDDGAPDPAPGGVVLAAEPRTVVLTRRDLRFTVRVSTGTVEPVRFRVEVTGDHLAPAVTVGEIRGELELEVAVDASRAEPGRNPGALRIVTSRGELRVDAPLLAGLTAHYDGTLRYEGAGVPLGSVSLGLDLHEDSGVLRARIAGARSALFPEQAVPATGTGAYAESAGAELVIRDVRELPAEGGEGTRVVGRVLDLRGRPGPSGALEGTFTEDVHGLLDRPVRLHGEFHLERRDGAELQDFPVVSAVELPRAGGPGFPAVHRIYPFAQDADCPGPKAGESVVGAALYADAAGAAPFEAALTAVDGRAPSPAELLERCAADLAAGPGTPLGCVDAPALTCALGWVVGSGDTTAESAEVFASLVAHLLEPALLVAQDELVQALRAGLIEGAAGERHHLEVARALLAPALRTVLSGPTLARLARLAPSAAAKSPDAPGGPRAERALRAVARAVELGGLLDAELGAARLHDTQLSAEQRVAAAQGDALATFVRGATLAGVLDAWGDAAPPGVTRRLVDVFSPAEGGFRAALEGATVFGVPEGFVPFLREAGRSNFDAVHASIAPLLDELDADHARFVESDRAFEAAEDQLDRELEAVRDGLTVQLEELCGAPLEPPPAPGDAARVCRESGGGRMAQVWLDIAEAAARVQVADGRAQAQADKIRVVEERVAAVSEIREGTLRFTAETGAQLASTVMLEAALNAQAAFVNVASQAQVLNFGTPIGLAGWAALVELQRGAIALARQELETAQTLRLQQDEALVEQIHGLSEVRGMIIDLRTIVLESALATFGVARARLELENLMARAERLVGDREESLARIGESSLRDPTFRVLRGRHAERALASRAAARRGLVLAGRALEYELGRSLGAAIPEAVEGAFDAAAARSLANCYLSLSDGAEMSRQAAQPYVTELSLRERLGVHGPRPDTVTGRTLSAGEQFRALVRREGELDAERGLSVRFTSALDPREGLWPANLCDDRIVSVEAQLVGDRLGDAEAQVVLELEGGGLLRACEDDQVHAWSTGGAAVLQAGVNAYPVALEPNGSLSGLPVASSRFRLRVPGGAEAPANADLDLDRIDDVVLRVRHAARPLGSTGLGVSLECLARSGLGR